MTDHGGDDREVHIIAPLKDQPKGKFIAHDQVGPGSLVAGETCGQRGGGWRIAPAPCLWGSEETDRTVRPPPARRAGRLQIERFVYHDPDTKHFWGRLEGDEIKYSQIDAR